MPGLAGKYLLLISTDFHFLKLLSYLIQSYLEKSLSGTLSAVRVGKFKWAR